MSVIIGVFSRPADTNTYSPGDVIGSSQKTGNEPYQTNFIGLNGGMLLNSISQVRVISDKGKTLPKMELWLFRALHTDDSQKDNTPFSIRGRELRNLICVISLANLYQANKAGGCMICSNSTVKIPIDPSNHFIGILVVRESYTPASEETFIVQVSGS